MYNLIYVTTFCALDQALCLYELCLHYRLDYNNNSPTLATLDIQSAYDTVDRAIIWRVLEPTAFPPLLGLLQSLFDNVSIQVLLSGTTSRSFWPATSVPQRSILSPHLYSIYINSLPQFLCSPSSFYILSNLSDSDSDFQDTPILSSRQRPHRLVCGYHWNPSKCIVLQQPTSQNINPLPPLYLYDQPLPTASTFVYLGIPFNASGMINNQQLLQRNIASALMVIVPFLKKEIQQLEKGQDQCLHYIFGGHAKSSTIVFRHMANLPTMDECKLLPLPHEDASPRDRKSTICTYRTTNLHKLQQGPNAGVLIKACCSKLGVDSIFFLPMTSRERSRLLCWQMGWLPGARPYFTPTGFEINS
ncbi:hypothetical protein INT45_014334, partial [Circinella minor]